MPAYYPVFLDIRDRRCVVIGGGDLGKEKAIRLLEYGAQVEVISPEINDDLMQEVDGKHLAWTRRAYQPGDLEGAFVAIVADTSDAKINRSISVEAKARNVPLNVSDVTHLCTWIAPAVVRRGEVIVAASTGGASPALARKFREVLESSNRIPSHLNIMEWADLAPLLSEVRSELAEKSIRINVDHWQACLTDDLVELVQSERHNKAKEELISRLLVATECDCQHDVCKMWENLPHEVEVPVASTSD